MDEQKVAKLLEDYNLLTYDEKKSFYLRTFSLGRVGEQLNDLLVLLSITTLTYLQLKKKNQSISPLSILQKITNQPSDDSYFYKVLESLSILTEDLANYYDKADSCGLKDSTEILTKIKNLLNTWTPF